MLRPVVVHSNEDGATGRWAAEAAEDERLLRWVGRFRFVTAVLAGRRFDRSERRIRSRLARLEAVGDVVSYQAHLAAPKLFALSKAGASRLGLPVRRAPRWDAQVGHELAIVDLIVAMEVARSDVLVLTERECRQLEAAGRQRYSVSCMYGRHSARRWPDIVVETADHRVAVEIEIAAKGSDRLRAIMRGYRASRRYDRVQIRCASTALQRRMTQLADGVAAGLVQVLGPADT